jgi:N-acetylglucosaminyldiphosphoundecaprenol N-acetyl-beta-D-mannosaminyltransferase
MRIDFLGYDLYNSGLKNCGQDIMTVIDSGMRNCKVLACLNPHSYVEARNDPNFKGALRRADWLIPDGAGIIIGAKILGLPIRERVSGPDVFYEVMELLNAKQGSVFFLGSSKDTLAKIASRVERDYPKIKLSGIYSPPFTPEFTPEQNNAMIKVINRAQPDILWVGMTAPKQEKWLTVHRDHLNVPVAGAVGAAFDFFAGTVHRSPYVFRRMGLEWLPRLIRQPRRLWRRMCISAPIFMVDVLRSSSVYKSRSNTTK